MVVDPLEGGPPSSRGLTQVVSLGSLPRGPDPSLLPEGEVTAGQVLAIALLLVLPDPSQDGAQALVGNDVGRPDARLGIDEDGDGLADCPADPGCFNPCSFIEDPQCKVGATATTARIA